MNNRRNGRRGSTRRGRGNRSDYRGRGRGGYRGRGGNKRNRDNYNNNMHGMNMDPYYSQYYHAQQAMSYPGFYYQPNQNPQQLMMQQMAQAQLGGYAGFPPAMMGFPQQMMQHHPNAMNGGMPMLQQTNTENEGFSVSEQPENLTDENDNHAKIDNNDENESNGETKSV